MFSPVLLIANLFARIVLAEGVSGGALLNERN